MNFHTASPASTVPRDVGSGLVVFIVALPLCLGIALASSAPLFSGLLAGTIGGIVVGMLSGSRSSVSGPAVALTTVVATQIATLGSYESFLLAVVFAGMIQIGLGIVQAGGLAAYIPTSVIKGLLAAIGVILILKQIPHLFGHDSDPEGDMAFSQVNQENSFTEFGRLFSHIHPGAAVIGLASIALLILWDRWKPLKRSGIPAPLIVALSGVGMSLLFQRLGGHWAIGASQLVQVPVAEDLGGYLGFLKHPDFSQWSNPAVYTAALTIAAVATLASLLNLEAADKIDPEQRVSPPSRELLAQGAGNILSGLIGGLPVTSEIVRSSVNIHAGARSKLSTIVHGTLLLVSVVFLGTWLNMIPLSSLAAILLVTGMKLASPVLVKQMWSQGRYQFAPFAVTVTAIVLTDLLVGVVIGLGLSIAFILSSNIRRPIRRIIEKHLGGEVVHLVLASQVSFFNRAALIRVLDEIPAGGHVLIDAQNTDYIDPDVLHLLRDFKEQTGPARGVEVSLLGFRAQYRLEDQTQYVDYSTRQLQRDLTPRQILGILKEGHERFRTGRRLTRDLGRQVSATANGQHPLAVVLSCVDSRSPAELIFDLGVGDIFSVRIAGNITSRKVLGSLEYCCAVAGAKLILVMGHTRCGAVTAAVEHVCSAQGPDCEENEHIGHLLHDIIESIDSRSQANLESRTPDDRRSFIDEVARRNVERVTQSITRESHTLDALVRSGGIAIVGALYDVTTGDIQFLPSLGPKDAHDLSTV